MDGSTTETTERVRNVFDHIYRFDVSLEILIDILHSGPDSMFWPEANRHGFIQELRAFNHALQALDTPALPGMPRFRRVIVESPYAGETKAEVARNEAYARLALADCLKRNEAPYASHLLYTQPGVLDDTIPEERKLGIEAGLLWGRLAQASVVYTDLGISPGMQKGINRAKAEGRIVEERTIPGWENMIRPAGEDLAVALERLLPLVRANLTPSCDPDGLIAAAERVLAEYRGTL